jgi:hypothetical protein
MLTMEPAGSFGSDARRIWHKMQRGSEDSAVTPLWSALRRVPDTIVFGRATSLLEARQGEMETRCEPLLGDWPRPAVREITTADAVAMQTIVSSYIDALDQVNSVLDTITSTVSTGIARAVSVFQGVEKSMDAHFQDTERDLAQHLEDVSGLDERAASDLRTNALDLERALTVYTRAQGGLDTVLQDAMACRNARVEVMGALRQGLMLEAVLAQIAR